MGQRTLPSVVYHLAEAANWPSIRRHGLLSASALLAASGLRDDERRRLEHGWRPAHTRLPDGVEIRDQRPMPPAALHRCLVGVTPDEWYRELNARVFFWLDPERLGRQRAACAHRPQVVLTIDVERLLARHASRVALSPINSGNARRRPAIRGRSTFVPYAAWLASGWSTESAGLGTSVRPASHRPVELTVEAGVPDVMTVLVGVAPLSPSQSFAPKVDARRRTPRPAGLR